MQSRVRQRFWVELTASIASGALLGLTLVWHDWIELVFGADPDHHSGSLEWGIVAVATVLTVVLAISARSEWRRRRPWSPSVGAAGR